MFIEVNGARIYYECFGEDDPGQAPIVLIHGSTGSGHSNWKLAAPLLARHYRVIVPDCRGHGQSSNPNHSYTFKEMAADTAALVQALGYRRAHIIGHSNGGNVALVTLLEHPEIVQTAIPQAANAFVSPDLPEKEPPLFDPDRVARDDPRWMQEMIALHGPTHGQDYWRELLRITLAELICEPNYTPADLAKVQHPTLVIQGENDRVNAPARHAQFIARHISHSELWIPSGIGHNVHDEVLFEWVEHVLDFLKRRGDDANDALYRLKQDRYADERETVFKVRAALQPDLLLSGQVLVEEQRVVIQHEIRSLAELRGVETHDQVQALLTPSTPWALARRSVSDLRRTPSIRAERISQILLGEVVRILEKREGWCFVRLEKDGYLGWVQNAALYLCPEEEALIYQRSCTLRVMADIAPAYNTSHPFGLESNKPGGRYPESGKVPFGVLLPPAQIGDNWCAVRLPGGERWWLRRTALLTQEEQPHPNEAGIAYTLALVQRFIGVPYLWGGRTPFGFDCSGLAQAFWGFIGVSLPRDADQQFRIGQAVSGPIQPGDLLFFGEADDPEAGERYAHINHVAISLGGEDMIHSNGSAWSVSYNSLDPASPRFRADLKEHLLGARRYG